MTNEVSSITPVNVSPPSPSLASEKSAAPSLSGKQVPPPGETQPESQRNPVASSQEEVLKAAAKLSEHAKNLGRDLRFEVDKDSGQTVVKVIDPETEEVVRQIPSEEAVERARSKDVSTMNIVDDIV